MQRAIHSNVSRLAELARGQVRVKSRGRVKENFLMLHRECITVHPSFSDTLKIIKIYRLTETSTYEVKGETIEFKTGVKGDDSLTITANNEVEFQHWCYALGMAVARLRKDASKSIIPPPHYPVHSGYLLFWDSSMKWKKKYVVLTEDSLFINEHRRIGFGTPPLRYSLVGSQPFTFFNVMLFAHFSSIERSFCIPTDTKWHDLQNIFERVQLRGKSNGHNMYHMDIYLFN
jgi:hypothetical protein